MFISWRSDCLSHCRANGNSEIWDFSISAVGIYTWPIQVLICRLWAISGSRTSHGNTMDTQTWHCVTTDTAVIWYLFGKKTCFIIKQLDVGMSPPAFSFPLIVTLTFDPDLWPWPLVTFDLDPLHLWPLNNINAQIKVKKSRFSTLRPWPLTHDLDLYTRPRHHLHSSPYKIWLTYSKRFWRYEFFSSDFFSSKCENHVFQHTDLDLWPMTLGFTHDLDMVHIHHHTKFGDPRSNGSWDMNFFLVTFFLVFSRTDRQTDRRTDRRTEGDA